MTELANRFTSKTKPASVSTLKRVLVDVRPKAASAPRDNARVAPKNVGRCIATLHRKFYMFVVSWRLRKRECLGWKNHYAATSPTHKICTLVSNSYCGAILFQLLNPSFYRQIWDAYIKPRSRLIYGLSDLSRKHCPTRDFVAYKRSLTQVIMVASRSRRCGTRTNWISDKAPSMGIRQH